MSTLTQRRLFVRGSIAAPGNVTLIPAPGAGLVICLKHLRASIAAGVVMAVAGGFSSRLQAGVGGTTIIITSWTLPVAYANPGYVQGPIMAIDAESDVELPENTLLNLACTVGTLTNGSNSYEIEYIIVPVG